MFRILSSILFCFLVVMVFVSPVHAADDLLSGKSILIGSDRNSVDSSTLELTDSNLNTPVGTFGPTRIPYYVFDDPVSIDGVFYHAGSNLTIEFYGVDGTLLSSTMAGKRDKIVVVPIPVVHDVKKVVFYFLSDSWLKEVRVYGGITGEYGVIPPDVFNPVVEKITHNSAVINYVSPSALEFDRVDLYLDGVLFLKDYKSGSVIRGLEPFKNYNFTLKTVNSYNNFSPGVNVGFMTLVEPLDEVTGLSIVDVTDNSFGVFYNLPVSSNFQKVSLYLDGNLFIDNFVSGSIVGDLDPLTRYDYVIKVHGKDNSVSDGLPFSVTTLAVPPPPDIVPPAEIIDFVSVSTYYGFRLSWKNPFDSDFKHVNVYVNGLKVGTSVNGSFIVDRLLEGTDYDVKLTTVDFSGNESNGVVHNLKTLIKPVFEVPTVKANYSLADVARSIDSWFSSLWLIVAFAISIPLSFIVGYRVKNLFF